MKVIDLWQNLRDEGICDDEIGVIVANTKLRYIRFQGIMRSTKLIRNIPGYTAEIGCSSGGTSLLIARMCGRTHFACDTFDGLSDVSVYDGSLVNGMFRGAVKKQVEAILYQCDARVIEGYFPECAPSEMANGKFALVHIDVDTYQSTRAVIGFFLEHMSLGGVMVLDDVIGTQGRVGAWKAWEEIKSDSRIEVMEINKSQAIVRTR